MPATISIPPLEELRGAAKMIAARHALDLVVLFGSAARRDGTVIHDLDVAVHSRTAAVDDVAITNNLIELLHLQAIDVVDLRRADPVLLFEVARAGVPLFEAEPTSFGEFVSLAARRYADTSKFRVAERQYIDDYLQSRRGPQ